VADRTVRPSPATVTTLDRTPSVGPPAHARAGTKRGGSSTIFTDSDPDTAPPGAADDQPRSAGGQATPPPDFTLGQRRWTTVALAVLGIIALAALVIGVLVVSSDSTRPQVDVQAPPPPSPTTTASAVPPPMAASPSAPPPAAPAPPPELIATATASTIVLAPPAPDWPAPEPNPGVQQRLHDLFPRLFPNP